MSAHLASLNTDRCYATVVFVEPADNALTRRFKGVQIPKSKSFYLRLISPLTMLLLFFALCSLINWSYAIPVTVKNCIPWAGHLNITAIRIPNCVAEPCLMRIEVPLDVEIDFTPGITLDSVQAQSTVSYFGDYFLLTLMSLEEICNTTAARFKCPVEANHMYTINGKLLVSADPGEATKLPGTWTVDVRTSGIKAQAAEITDCSMTLMIDH